MGLIPRARRTGGRSWSVAWLGVLPLLAGCSQVLGADEYATSKPSIFPFGPDCEVCLEETCPEAVQNCQDDPECLALATCRGERFDPAHNGECNEGSQEPIATGYDLFKCTRNNCLLACGGGTRWDCVGDWVLPTPAPGVTQVEKVVYVSHTGITDPWQGVTVRACDALTSGPCTIDNEDAHGVTDANGRTEFSLPITARTIGPSGWTGSYQLDGAGIYAHRRPYRHPTVRDGYSSWALASSGEVEVLLRLASLPTEPAPGTQFVTVESTDCAGMIAAGATIALTSDVGGAIEPKYLSADGKFDPALDHVTSSGLTAFRDVPIGGAVVEMRSSEGQLVARYPFQVVADWNVVLSLGPDSVSDRL